jgi:RNA polymerase sigma factor (sigma-70 family)
MLLRRRHSDPRNDEDLAKAVKHGSGEALALLWDRYAHLLYGVGLKYLKDGERSREEVLELFSGLPALLKRHQVARFKPWVHVVMRNRCLLALRGARHTSNVEEVPIPADEDSLEDKVLHEARLSELEEAMGRLNDGQRECIRLFYLERLSYQQVSERTGIGMEQVRSHLQNGKRNLRILLQRHG